MVLAEIVHTCTHDAVAHAAAASLGPEFLDRVRRAAQKRALSPGAFVAQSVQRFSNAADEPARRALQTAVRGTDMPLLRGLALIVEPDLVDRSR